jgi:hypothetical protein
MESLAYIHIALEYEKAWQSAPTLSQFGCQQQSTNTPTKVYPCQNWWQIKFFSSLPRRQNSKVA